MLPAHAADIEDMLSFMPRTALTTLSDLLGQLRDGLHARAERTTPRPRRQGPSRRRAG